MTHKTINNDNLLQLIDRYFDGATSTEEERRLRDALAATDLSSPAIDEARAVMGVFAAARRIAPPPRRRLWPKLTVAAASLAMLIGVAVWFRPASADSLNFALIGSQRIDDYSEIESMMHADLSCIADARSQVDASIAAELEALNDVIDFPQP